MSNDLKVDKLYLIENRVEVKRSYFWDPRERMVKRLSKRCGNALFVKRDVIGDKVVITVTALEENEVTIGRKLISQGESCEITEGVTRVAVTGDYYELRLIVFNCKCNDSPDWFNLDYPLVDRKRRGKIFNIFQCFWLEEERFMYVKVANKQSYADHPQYASTLLLINEIEKLRRLNHENVISMHDYKSSVIYECYIMMERARGPNLEQLLKTRRHGFSEVEWRHLAKQIVSGIDHVHLNDIVHHNIALDNIVAMTTDHYPRVKITSFGRSRFSYAESSDPCRRSQQSLRFQAPEVLTTAITRSGCKCGKKIDVWSLGVCFYMLLVGDCPFGIDESSDDEEKVLTKIRNKRSMFCPLFDDEKISAEAKMFVRDCLSEEEGRRPTSGELATCRYLTTYDVVLI